MLCVYSGGCPESSPATRKPKRTSIAHFGICDTVESSNVGLIRRVKLPIYHRLGLSHLWLVDRIQNVLEVYSAAAAGEWHLDGAFRGNGRLRASPFRHAEFNLDGIWDDWMRRPQAG